MEGIAAQQVDATESLTARRTGSELSGFRLLTRIGSQTGPPALGASRPQNDLGGKRNHFRGKCHSCNLVRTIANTPYRLAPLSVDAEREGSEGLVAGRRRP